MELSHIILPLFLVWTIGMLLLLIRRRFAPVWKISIFFVWLFYLLWFWNELFVVALARYIEDYASELPRMLGGVVAFIPVILLVLWPIVVWMAYRSRDLNASVVLLRNMTLFTLFFWMFWLLAHVLSFPLAEQGLGQAVRQVLPEKIEIPLAK